MLRKLCGATRACPGLYLSTNPKLSPQQLGRVVQPEYAEQGCDLHVQQALAAADCESGSVASRVKDATYAVKAAVWDATPSV